MPLETKFKKSILENQNYMAVGAVLSSCAHKFPVGRSPNFPGRGLSSNFPERKASPPSLYVQLKTRICTRVTSVASVHQRNRRKELSLCHKLKCCNPYILAICWCKLIKFQTLIIWSNIIYSLKCLRSTTLGCKDIRIGKSEFVAKTQFLYFLK